ncbi:MAG: ArsR/SmtB family transcription factor [Planctomycetota bacterium]
MAKALAHPSRLLMMDALAQGEHCVNDLTELVGSDQSTVSKHLGVLRNAGLVDLRKEGTQAFYRIKVPCLEGFWGCIETVLSKNLKEQKRALGA